MNWGDLNLNAGAPAITLDELIALFQAAAPSQSIVLAGVATRQLAFAVAPAKKSS